VKFIDKVGEQTAKFTVSFPTLSYVKEQNLEQKNTPVFSSI